MKLPSRDALLALAYAGNQGLAVLSTILLLRYGQQTLGLTWVVGAMLAVGWGTTLYGIVGPTLSATLWHTSRAKGGTACARALFVALCVLPVVSLLPRAVDFLTEVAGISMSWQLWFTTIGLLRAFAQTMSTYSVRHGRHEYVLRFQLAGRFVEIGLMLAAGLSGEIVLLVCAWLAYPGAQLVLLATEWQEYGDGTAGDDDAGGQARAALYTQASQVFDLVMPSIWLRGGPEIFVAYRAVTSALANSTMLPRYWYVLSSDKPRGEQTPPLMLAAVVGATLLFSALFQVGSNAVPWDIFAWSLIPLLVNGAVLPDFSRLRQLCLNQGRLLPPALALIIGRAAELAALSLAVLGGMASGAVIVAYTGFAACAPALRYFHRRYP